MKIPERLKQLSNKILLHGGRLFVVGGAVRDWVMGIEPNDLDLLITGMSEADFLGLFPGAVKALRNEAPVWIVDGLDVALARREISTGKGKNGFEFIADPNMTVEQDLRRRDFTINAMAWDIAAGVLIDPFGGKTDIRLGLLRHVSPAFVESPERVFRLASFAARFGFKVDMATVTLCRHMLPDFETIAVEQIWRHFEKGLSKAKRPSAFIQVLQLTWWVERFPQMAAMIACPQDPEWHPEGDVFTHTGHVMDAAPKGDIVMQLAALCHDMGKATTTDFVNGRWVSPGHAQTDDAADFLAAIGCPNDIKAEVLALVRCHMDHIGVNVTPRFVRRLSKRIEPANIEKLAALVLADHSGRPPLKAEMPVAMAEILAMAAEMHIDNEPVKPLVMGRDLIQMGLKPGPSFGVILGQAFEAQIEGQFETHTDGLEFVRGLLI